MDTFIGLLELVAWIVVVLALAATVTYGVIKLTQAWQARRKVVGQSGPAEGA
jgi:hypothetical protein